MFRACINRTPFTSDIANDFFNNIRGDDFQGDITFLSTLRALVAPRMKDGDTLSVQFGSVYGVDSAATARGIVRTVYPTEYISTNSIYILSCDVPPNDSKAIMDAVEAAFCDVYPSFHRLEKITVFYRKQFRVMCFMEPERRRVFIFCDNLNMRNQHYLQASLFALLPWYFDADVGVDNVEMALISSLREKTPDNYEEIIAQLASRYDFKTARVRKLLKGFETKYERKALESVKIEITRCDRDVDALRERIADRLHSRRDAEIRLLGLEAKIAQADDEPEIMEYFLSHKCVHLESVDDTTLTFVATGYIEYFDEELVQSALDNPRSYIYMTDYSSRDNIIPKADIRMLMEEIFLKQTLKLRSCAAYRFRLGEEVKGLDDYQYSNDFNTYMPNTHIDRYHCLGNYELAINQLIQKNDYIMAIEQCVESCKSLNFGDGCVMEEMMRRIYGVSRFNVNTRCIELPDGSVVTPKEAIEYLKSEVQSDEQTD